MGATGRAEGDASGRGTGRGIRARTRACLPCGLPRRAWRGKEPKDSGNVSLAPSRGSWEPWVPRGGPRETDSAVGRPEGDGIGPRNVTITGFRGSRRPWVPRDVPRVTLPAAGRAEGYGHGPAPVSLAGFRARRGTKRAEGERERLPRALSRRPDAADATGWPEGDGFWHETVRGRRIRASKRLPCRLPWHLGAGHPGHMTFVLESCSCEKLLNLIIGFLMTRPSSSENVPSDTTINARLCTSSMP